MAIRRLVFVAAWLVLFLGFLHWLEPGFWQGSEGHYESARELLEEGRTEEALAAVDRALRHDPDDAGYLRTRGYLSLELGDPEGAAEAFRRSLEGEPAHPEALLGLARAELAAGRPDDARTALARLPEALDDADHRLERARLLERAGDRDGALARYRALVEERPGDPGILEEASSLAAMAGAWDDAAAWADRLAEAAPDEEARRRALERRARAAWAADRPGEAWEAYQEIAGPGDREERAALALELERYGEAADLHRELVHEGMGGREAREALAYALSRAGRLAEAGDVYAGLVAEDPEAAELLVDYVHVLNRRGRYAEAWAAVSALETPSPDPTVHGLQARTAHWAGEEEAAAELLASWARLAPGDPRPHRLLAENRRRAGDPEGRAAALEAYLELRPDDGEARLALGRLLGYRGALSRAILQYQEALGHGLDDRAEVHEELGRLLEGIDEPELALRRYRRAADLAGAEAGETPAGLERRLARAHMAVDDPAGAVPWYERLLDRTLEPEAERRLTLELAGALLALDRAGEAFSLAAGAADADPGDAEAHLLAARAGSDAGRPAEAVRYLEGLSGIRALTTDERRWLAGQHRAAGEGARALALYEELLAEDPHDAALLHATGDLRLDRGDPAGALEAYGAIPAGERPAEVTLSVARARSAVDDRPGAVAAYRAYLEERPEAHEVRLELARTLVLAGRPPEAVPVYEAYAEARGSEGIGLEWARAYLEAGRYEEAAAAARGAEERGEDVLQARLARAQALGALGEVREADRLLADLAASPPPDDDPTWAARLAEARNQPVTAYLEARRALEGDPEDAGELHLLQARVLGSRGDVHRAVAGLERARRAGVDTARVRRTLDGFRDERRAEVELPGLLQGDGSDLRMPHGGVVARWSVADRLRLRAAGTGGRLEQEGISFDRWVLSVAVQRWFPLPEAEVRAGMGWEEYGSAGGLLVAHAAGAWGFGGGWEAGLAAERSSLWSAHDRFEPRGFNRVTELAALGPDFRIHSARAHLVRRGTSEWETRAEAGVSDFEDGNRQRFGYAHRQIPLASRQGRWAVVRPNLYVESFSDEAAGYASPSLSASLGVAFHGIRDVGDVRIDGDLNPNLIWVDDELGPGGSGMVDVSRRVGAVRVGGTLFGYARGPEDYALWRLLARLTVPVGGGDGAP